LAVTPDNLASEPVRFHRETKRASNQARPDDRDLTDGHEGIESLNHRIIESFEIQVAASCSMIQSFTDSLIH
jgi:hypothetical protein